MNRHAANTDPQPASASEALPRYKWSLAQFEQLIEHGILGEADRVELIEGEIVPGAPKGNRHEYVRDELHDWLVYNLPRDVRLSAELGWRPDSQCYLEADILVSRRGHRPLEIPALSVSLGGLGIG